MFSSHHSKNIKKWREFKR